jgi:YesN/AraC family two-component response regulator
MNIGTREKEYLQKLTVLFVEDEIVTFEQCCLFLSGCVGSLKTARNGSEGLQAYQKYHPHIIITDINMPVMDGLTMAEKIREQDTNVQIIVLSSYDQADYLMKSIQIDIDKYVTKPLDGSRLLDALLLCARSLMIQAELNKTNTPQGKRHVPSAPIYLRHEPHKPPKPDSNT